ncbi:MAG TPA: chemotaxis protein CheX [Candidatus Acidoferrales bacterium]|nr:chemotaxis protein CheX [Candidatus Acidoferrales bacterium]
MCSLIPSLDEGLSEEQRKGLSCMEVRFSGPIHGSLVMAAEKDAAEMLAPAFLRQESDQLAPDTVAAVLAEMANVICGATVSRIAPDGLFSLSTPEPRAHLPAEQDSVELGLDCGCGSIVVQLRIE